MARKKIAKICKLQFPGGGAKPGPALASAGINMPQFCTDFNAKTQDRKGDIVPVIITAYEDKTFDFVIKTTPAAVLLKKAAGIAKASGTPNTVKAGKITVYKKDHCISFDSRGRRVDLFFDEGQMEEVRSFLKEHSSAGVQTR